MSAQFGQYQLLAPIASGGMAEVWFAERVGVAGFAREVVVKRMHSRLTNDDDYVRMFLDEARLTATLQHPNIAQVLDLGRAAGTWFIAMEYVDGPDLGRLASKVIRQGQQVPVGVAAWVVARAATGLHHAHQQVDPMSGQRLGLIHRDVSHANVLVSRHGDVKIIDFGIAHAHTRHAVTQAGVVKGKPGYLSPEQIRGETLSPSTDVFSLGVVLWELLTGQVLFRQQEHIASMEKTLEFLPPPPSALRPEVSQDLDSVVLAALDKDRSRRVSSAGELSALLDSTIQHLDDANREGLARWVMSNSAGLWPPEEVVQVTARRTHSASSDTPGMVSAPELSVERLRPQREPTVPRAGASSIRGAAAGLEAGGLITAGRRPLKSKRSKTEPNNQAPPPKDNLERDVAPLVGRGDLLEQLSSALAAGDRLITLTGEAGVGKSRLAAAFAVDAAPRFAEFGGTWHCSLTSCKSLDDVCRKLAFLLGIPLDDSHTDAASVDAIGKALAGRGATLLWLDDAGKQREVLRSPVRAWLKASARLLILATSRRPLSVRGERVLVVPPLNIEGGLMSDAGDLLRRRVEEAGVDVALLDTEPETVHQLLAHSQGLPFAIELAAAKIAREGEVRGKETTTDDGFVALTTALREAWTQLLTWEQTSLLHALSFPGGFHVESLAEVIDPRGFDDAESAAQAAIETLRSRSLVKSVPGVSDRFIVHDNLRSWVRREELIAPAQVEELKLRYRSWAVRFAERCRQLLLGHRGESARRSIFLEFDNLLAAHRAAVDGDPSTCLRLAVALGPFLLERGPLGLLDSMLDQALNAHQGQTSPSLSEALALKAEVKTRRGSPKLGLSLAKKALLMAEESEDRRTQGAAWLQIGACYRRMDRSDKAMNAVMRARDLASEDLILENEALYMFGSLYLDLAEKGPARRCFETALAGAQRVGHRHLVARAQAKLGRVQMDHGEIEEAERNFEAALTDERALGNLRGMALCSCYLALVHQERGDLTRAEELLRESATRLAEVGDQFRRAYVIGFYGWNLMAQAKWEEADEVLAQTTAFFLDKGDRKLRTIHVAFYALCLRQLGLHDEARSTLKNARALAHQSADAISECVVDLMELACSDSPDETLAAAEARARAPRPPASAPRPSFAAVSSEVRLALQFVERWGGR